MGDPVVEVLGVDGDGLLVGVGGGAEVAGGELGFGFVGEGLGDAGGGGGGLEEGLDFALVFEGEHDQAGRNEHHQHSDPEGAGAAALFT